MRPTIAITTWRRELPTFLGERTLLYTLGDEYVRSVRGAGGLPVLLPHLDPDDVATVLDQVDGLLVAGGGDVHPASYGAALDGSQDVDAAADGSELRLLRLARERDLPTLAVCRGMQLVNVAAGGTLRQEVTADGTPHPPMTDDPGAVLAARHEVEILPGSRLAEVFGPGPRQVNTIHHQALDRLGDGLRVTATAGDGIIEAVEHDDWRLLAVQWHPEKLGATDAPLFRWLVDTTVVGAGATTTGTPPPRGAGRTVG